VPGTPALAIDPVDPSEFHLLAQPAWPARETGPLAVGHRGQALGTAACAAAGRRQRRPGVKTNGM